MGFESIGSLADFAKMKYTQTKWNQRKANGFAPAVVKSAGSTSAPGVPLLANKAPAPQQGLQKADALTNGQKFIEMYGYDPEKQAVGTRVEMITTKMKSGIELSGDDLEFLKANAPELYEKAVQIAQERKQYEEALARCKTKDDVQRLNTQRLSAYMNEGQAIMHSNMTRAQKMEKMEFLGMRVNAIRNEHAKFVASPEYEKLPWEHELEEDDDRRKKDAKAEDEDRAEMQMKLLLEALQAAAEAPETGETGASAAGGAENAGTANSGAESSEAAPEAEAVQQQQPARAPSAQPTHTRGAAVHGAHHVYSKSGATTAQASPAAPAPNAGAVVSVKA